MLFIALLFLSEFQKFIHCCLLLFFPIWISKRYPLLPIAFSFLSEFQKVSIIACYCVFLVAWFIVGYGLSYLNFKKLSIVVCCFFFPMWISKGYPLFLLLSYLNFKMLSMAAYCFFCSYLNFKTLFIIACCFFFPNMNLKIYFK